MVAIPIRELLDVLGEMSPDSIKRLSEKRGLTGRGMNARCESLARSYRGDYEQLFDELLKTDLVALLDDPTEIDGENFFLPDANRYSKPELVDIALEVFRDEDPSALEVCDDDDDDDDDDDEDDDDDDEDEDDGVDLDAYLREAAQKHVEEALRAARRAQRPDVGSSCPCGSGRPFKQCHGAVRPEDDARSRRTASDTYSGSSSSSGSWGGNWSDARSESDGPSARGRHNQAQAGSAASTMHANEVLVLSMANLAWPVSDDQLRVARRELTILLHPDRHATDSRAANAAHNTLSRVNDGFDRLFRRLAR